MFGTICHKISHPKFLLNNHSLSVLWGKWVCSIPVVQEHFLLSCYQNRFHFFACSNRHYMLLVIDNDQRILPHLSKKKEHILPRSLITTHSNPATITLLFSKILSHSKYGHLLPLLLLIARIQLSYVIAIG